MPLVIEVAAALIQDEAGRYLITQRGIGYLFRAPRPPA